MKHLIAALGLLLVAAIALPVQAADVAMLDWRRALMETDDAQRAMSDLESRIGTQQQQAQRLGQELQEMQQRLQQMSDSERQSLLPEFQQKGVEFEALRQQVVQAQQQTEQQFLQEAEIRLDRAVEEVISRHEVQVLVEPQGVLHATRELPDLTAEVTQIFNTLD
jgi:outer membrane protein